MSRTDPHQVLFAANPVPGAVVNDEQRLAAIRAAVDTRRAAVDTRPAVTSLPRRSFLHRRLAVLSIAAAVAAGTTAVVAHLNAGDTRVIAMGQSEMSPVLQKAARLCLTPGKSDPTFPLAPPGVTMADLTVAVQRDDRVTTLFIGPRGYHGCEVDMTPGEEDRLSSVSLPWTSKSKDWLPGPVQVLGMSSTEFDGGDVSVTGRVSDQVHRLLLDYGDGHTTAARLTRGTFGLISDGRTVKRTAELVSYDANGTEIGRDRLFRHLDQTDDHEQCYVDPTGTVVVDPDGTVVHGKPGKNCSPAQPWRR
jgi:hypothetical protein